MGKENVKKLHEMKSGQNGRIPWHYLPLSDHFWLRVVNIFQIEIKKNVQALNMYTLIKDTKFTYERSIYNTFLSHTSAKTARKHVYRIM